MSPRTPSATSPQPDPAAQSPASKLTNAGEYWIEDVDKRINPLVQDFQRQFLHNLHYLRGVGRERATANDCYQALGYTVRQYLMQDWLDTLQAQVAAQAKYVIYLSAEYLMGRQLDNALLNAGLTEVATQALAEMELKLDDLRKLEAEPGLGNGGLGRLAACFIDSLATLQIPAFGYGIRYEYGIFRQTFVDGWQVEQPDDWLLLGNPWEFPHPEHAVEVGFGGRSEPYHDELGRSRIRWIPQYTVLGVPYNTMVPGYRSGTVNTLRLWSARATQGFNLAIFNAGDYLSAVHDKTYSENISKVLYPEDSTPQGRLLRLQQQYFFVACSLRDLFRLLPVDFDLRRLPERIVMQLNDTHPTVAIPELMRLLVDDHALNWDDAWSVTKQVFAYTNHTLLPEALEKWSVDLFGSLLPRHLEIVYEINQRFLGEVRARFPGDEERVRRMSIIEEGPVRSVRMAHLASVGSFRINGVASLQSRLLAERVLVDFSQMWPEKFTNVTNGVTPRRFVGLANPELSALISSKIGEGWLNRLDDLRKLETFVGDADFCAAWRTVQRNKKHALAEMIQREMNITVNPNAVFDIMVKRLHEYKRQLLKVLHIITLYNRILADPQGEMLPRVVIFGAKAAPGYWMAKRIIKLINSVADVVNNDPQVGDRLKVVYLPNYSVSMAERIIPAADISEQISMAGKEASGTGNMKFALNGALTVGTLDGANIEIRDLVGAENFFLFGLTEGQVQDAKRNGYWPRGIYENNLALRQVIDQIGLGVFSHGDTALFAPIVNTLLDHDEYMHLADYQAYVDIQDEVERAYRDEDRWTRMSILNVARCGYFSSDRSIRDYLANIWGARPVFVPEWRQQQLTQSRPYTAA